MHITIQISDNGGFIVHRSESNDAPSSVSYSNKTLIFATYDELQEWLKRELTRSY